MVLEFRDVNKDLTFKAKAKAKAKDLAFKAKDKARTFRCNPVELHWLFDTTSMAH